VPHSTQVGSSSQGGQGNGGEEDSEQLRSVGKGSDGDFFLFWRERERERAMFVLGLIYLVWADQAYEPIKTPTNLYIHTQTPRVEEEARSV
jgi:hypothetical protein